MASYTGQFVEGVEVDVGSMSDDEVDKCLAGCKGVLVCATGRDAFFPAGDSEGKNALGMTFSHMYTYALCAVQLKSSSQLALAMLCHAFVMCTHVFNCRGRV